MALGQTGLVTPDLHTEKFSFLATFRIIKCLRSQNITITRITNCNLAAHNTAFQYHMNAFLLWGNVEFEFTQAGVVWRHTGVASRRRWRRAVHGTATCQRKAVGVESPLPHNPFGHRSGAQNTKAQCGVCSWYKRYVATHVSVNNHEGKWQRSCSDLTY
jgi:hypothetical protein